jgi:hypothetical protein
VTVDDITLFVGFEVDGIRLGKLSDAGKIQLALYVVQRRVVGKTAVALMGHEAF